MTWSVVMACLAYSVFVGAVTYVTARCLMPKRYRSYAAYLRSPRWRRLSARARKRDGYRCTNKRCGSRVNLEVHHIRYAESWGKEKLSDLRTLCHKCHMAQHLSKAG